jgi:hypothetical protein
LNGKAPLGQLYKEKETKLLVIICFVSIGGFAHNRHAGHAGWRSQGVASHPGDAAAPHRSDLRLYRMVIPPSIGRQSVDRPRAGEVCLERNAVLTPYIPLLVICTFCVFLERY